MFLLISGDHICVPKLYTNLASKFYNGVQNVSANNSETVGDIDLTLGQMVYISVFCNISFPSTGWLPIFFFFALCLLRDNENDLLKISEKYD